MTEAYNVDNIGAYYGGSEDIVDQIGSISHMPLFFEMITKFKSSEHAESIDKKSGAEIVELVIISLLTSVRQFYFLFIFINSSMRMTKDFNCIEYYLI